MTITLAYRSVDGVRERKTFATLAGARRYANKRVGLDAEAWGVSATSFDGIGVLTLVEVMKEPPVAPFPIRDMETLLRGKATPPEIVEPVVAVPDATDELWRPRRSPGCTCSDMQLDRVGCDCDAER